MKQLRLSDAPERRPPGPGPEASPFLGDWRNTEPASPGISRVVITLRSGRPWIAISGGTHAEGPGTPFFQEDRPGVELGMTADLQGPVSLVMNVKHGVLVVAAYHQPADGPARYAREFYRPSGESDARDSAAPLVGEWHNVRADTAAVRALRVGQTVEALLPDGVWARASEVRFASTPGGPPTGFLAEIEDPARLTLAGNLNRGLLVLLMQWTPASGDGWFHREFLAPGPTR